MGPHWVGYGSKIRSRSAVKRTARTRYRSCRSFEIRASASMMVASGLYLPRIDESSYSWSPHRPTKLPASTRMMGFALKTVSQHPGVARFLV